MKQVLMILLVLFSFTSTIAQDLFFTIQGTIVEVENNVPVYGAQISLVDSISSDTVAVRYTDEYGYYNFSTSADKGWLLKKEQTVYIHVKNEGYLMTTGMERTDPKYSTTYMHDFGIVPNKKGVRLINLTSQH